MKSKKNLVLIGMMASGKSTIGAYISKIIKFNFFDIDKIIEKKVNMTVGEIFKIKGEIFFRKLEEKITIKLLNTTDSVISLGGGGFINNTIRKESIEKCETFWLDWDINILTNRIKKSKKRPIAEALNKIELKKLIIKRSKIYSNAKYRINCQHLNKFEIANKIINLYENN